MKQLKHIHLIFGIIVLVTFTLTGQYMHHKYNHLIDMPLTERALFRAGHIYILLFSLVNLSLGAYLRSGYKKYKRFTQVIGSTLIIIATFIIVYSFFTELPTSNIERPISRNGIYLLLAGVLFHSIPEKKV